MKEVIPFDPVGGYKMAYYLNQNIHPAHDLHYSWTGWPRANTTFPPRCPPDLTEHLRNAFLPDGLTLESHTWNPQHIHLSFRALPDHAPTWIAQRAKGRLDHTLRKIGSPLSFSRKVSLRAFGHNKTAVVETYIREQLNHVDLADPRYRQRLASAALHFPETNLSEPAIHSHSRYWYNLHLVFVVADRYRIGNPTFLRELRRRIAEKTIQEGYALKRAAIMPDHLHLALRGDPNHSPAQIATGLQQATAEVAHCRIWEEKFYVGTFGAYDCNAVEGSQGGVQE